MAEQAAPYPDPNVMQALTRGALARAFLFASKEDYEGAAALAEQARTLRPSSISARRTALLTLAWRGRSEEHTSELQSQSNLVCRLLLEKKNRRFRDVVS